MSKRKTHELEETPGVVPMYTGQPHVLSGTPPHLTYRNGPLLANVQVFTIFWGKKWTDPANQALPGQINTFFSHILKGKLMDELKEYNTSQYVIGHGQLLGSITITDTSPHILTLDSTIQKFIQTNINNKTIPQPTPNTLYFVYTPPLVRVQKGVGVSCTTFCGYHDSINSKIFYAVMPYPSCAGCLGNLSAFDALTSTSSHELCEAITDPIPGSGWYDDTHGEIGDICSWQSKKIGNYEVQLEWSNQHNKCI